jgi:hypothetical protein
MTNMRPYQQWYDGSTARTIGMVGDNPTNNEFLLIGTANRRVQLGTNGQGYAIADLAVNNRGAKNIIWSSEGYTWNGVPISAVTVANKKATGSSATQSTTSTLPSSITVPTVLDVSPYRAIVAVVSLLTITGTSFQPEIDILDDAASVIPVWKPTAATAGTNYYINIGFEATGTAPTVSGWTVTNIPVSPGAQIKFAWTNVATTVCTWTAYLYGIN